jgi:hypothetical protein
MGISDEASVDVDGAVELRDGDTGENETVETNGSDGQIRRGGRTGSKIATLLVCHRWLQLVPI